MIQTSKLLERGEQMKGALGDNPSPEAKDEYERFFSRAWALAERFLLAPMAQKQPQKVAI